MRYLYGMYLRGFSLGCQPMDGLVGHLNGKVIDGVRYHDLLIYSRKLTAKEERDYELMFLGDMGNERA